MTSCDEEIGARAATDIKNGFTCHNGRDQMRVSDPGERRRAIGGKRSKLGCIIAEECNRVCRTAMEVKISVWIRGDARVYFGNFFAHALRVDATRRILRIGHTPQFT